MLLKYLDFHIGLLYSKLSCLFHAMGFCGHLADAQSATFLFVIELMFLWQTLPLKEYDRSSHVVYPDLVV